MLKYGLTAGRGRSESNAYAAGFGGADWDWIIPNSCFLRRHATACKLALQSPRRRRRRQQDGLERRGAQITEFGFMARDNPRSWMLSEAVEALMRAERMHREVFQLSPTTARPASDP